MDSKFLITENIISCDSKNCFNDNGLMVIKEKCDGYFINTKSSFASDEAPIMLIVSNDKIDNEDNIPLDLSIKILKFNLF